MKGFIIAAFTLLILAVAIMQSCTKEVTFSFSNDSKTNSYQLKSEQDSIIQSRIITFMNRMKYVRENPEYEGSENWNYSEDSTIWYIEAALNMYLAYHYAFFNGEESAYLSDVDSTLTGIVPGDAGYNIVEIQGVFDYFVDIIIDSYDRIESEEKFFLLADIIGINEDGSIKVRYIIGKVHAINSSPIPWKWGWELGDCYGGNQGIDDADVLEMHKNYSVLPYPAYSNPINSCHYFTDVSPSGYILPTDYPVNPPHAYGDKMLFEDYQSITLVHHCVSPGEHSLYLNYLDYIANDRLPISPTGVQVLCFDIWDDTAFGDTGPPNFYDTWYMAHQAEITYGVQHNCTVPPPGF